MQRRHLLTAVIAASTILAGCATTATSSLPSVTAVAYRLAPGDKLKLEVFREDSLSGEYTINEQGLVGLPMVGEIKAAGKTLTQLREELAATLGQGYVRNAKISLNVVRYRPIYVLGEVQKPGEYEYVEQMSVYAVVAKAGGFTYRANQKTVFIRHADEASEQAYKLTSGASVLPGDTVRVEQRYF